MSAPLVLLLLCTGAGALQAAVDARTFTQTTPGAFPRFWGTNPLPDRAALDCVANQTAGDAPACFVGCSDPWLRAAAPAWAQHACGASGATTRLFADSLSAVRILGTAPMNVTKRSKKLSKREKEKMTVDTPS
mgnify:CR=1 FL=1